MKLYLNFERGLTSPETDRLREFIQRRSRHEPLQHITGSTMFCCYEIVVNRHVLVPRPETELLAELGWQFLNRLAQETECQAPPRLVKTGVLERGETRLSAPTALDFCTGSGCIAIALAAKCPHAKIVATDISPEALGLAKTNVAQNNVAERIELLEGNGFEALTGKTQFDLIISNPPYIPSAEIALLQPEVRDFDPRRALDGGADGLEFYRLIASQAKAFLKQDGRLMMEFGDGQTEAIRNIFETEKWIVEAVKEDYSHRARILVAKLSQRAADILSAH